MIQRATLTVNLHAIVANWEQLKKAHGNRPTAAVIKANGYGLGAVPVMKALKAVGCSIFFVATLDEALELRKVCNDVTLYVFQGMLSGEEAYYKEHHITPVINCIEQIQNFPKDMSAALHIDTAMQRLGISCDVLEDNDIINALHQLDLTLLMTHYACASDALSPITYEQRNVMQRASALLPHLPTSYANSAGHFLPDSFHGDITRPGCALYGINPLDNASNPMQAVATLTAPILQRRLMQRDETVGYGATARLLKGARSVTVAIGYADGIHRMASNQLYGEIAGHIVPLVGRVTMDMLCFDVSKVPEALVNGASHLTIMGPHQNVDDIARIYNTIGYEVLTSLGSRIQRDYI